MLPMDRTPFTFLTDDPKGLAYHSVCMIKEKPASFDSTVIFEKLHKMNAGEQLHFFKDLTRLYEKSNKVHVFFRKCVIHSLFFKDLTRLYEKSSHNQTEEDFIKICIQFFKNKNDETQVIKKNLNFREKSDKEKSILKPVIDVPPTLLTEIILKI